MKILFFNWRDITHPQAGGCELNLHEIAKRLVEQGHDVTLFCGAYEACNPYEYVDGIEVIRKGGKYSVYVFAFLTYISFLRKRKYDVVVDDINGIPFFTMLYVGRPKIAVLHHLVKNIFSKELPFMFRPIGYTAEWLIPKLYRNIVFVTVSKSSKEEMIEAGIPRDHIEIIHNGITSMYTPNWELKTPYPHILYVGRLKKYKQMDHLLHAVSFLRKSIPQVRLSIVGTGDNEEDLKQLAKKLHIDDIVTFHGFVMEEEKLRLIQSAWVFVTPSSKEGWGLTVIEANACGTPAIAYNVQGLRDSILDGETGLLVQQNRGFERLAEVVTEFLENTKLRQELSTKAVEWSKRFSWDNCAREFLQLLQEVSK